MQKKPTILKYVVHSLINAVNRNDNFKFCSKDAQLNLKVIMAGYDYEMQAAFFVLLNKLLIKHYLKK